MDTNEAANVIARDNAQQQALDDYALFNAIGYGDRSAALAAAAGAERVRRALELVLEALARGR